MRAFKSVRCRQYNIVSIWILRAEKAVPRDGNNKKSGKKPMILTNLFSESC